MSQLTELDYLVAERLGILTDGRREPTTDEIAMAYREALATVMRHAETNRLRAANDQHKLT